MRAVDETMNARINTLVSQGAAKHPERIAVCFLDQRLSYGELEERANGVAKALLENGVLPGELVGIYMDRSVWMPVAMLGVLKAGAAYVPMDPQYPAQRIQWMVEDAALKVMLTDAAHENEVRGFDVAPLRMEDLERGSTDPASVSGRLDSLAYVIFTSGSTGRPKGVQIPHRALTNFLVSMQEKPGMNADDVLLAVTTLSFDISGLEMFLPLLVGGRLVIASREMVMDGGALLRVIQEESITLMQATPVTWKLMLDTGWEATPELKVLCGGEAFRRDLANTLVDKAGSVWNMYGPTETTIWSTCDRVEKGDGVVSIGGSIANTTVYVVDDALNPVLLGDEGELVIGGAGLAIGYLKNQAMTDQKFVALASTGERVYRTGDGARFMPDGRLECLGRLDHQVKLRGFRIELEEVESTLRTHEAVRDAVVILHDRDDDPRLAAYLIMDSPRPEKKDGPASVLHAWLSDRLPHYMVPSSFTLVEAFPLTPNGKLDRKSLPEPAVGRWPSGQVEYESETEAALAEIWKELLAIEGGVPRTEDFFVLGGSSLKGAALFLRINERFGTDMTLAVLVQASTIQDLSRFIDRYEEDADERLSGCKALKVVQRGKPGVVPLFLVHGGDGRVLPFKDLVDNLEPDQPVYAFRWSGQDGEVCELDMKVQARAYMEDLLKFDPDGPFRIGGYCHGGLVAVELASNLRAAGATVLDPLIVFGAPNVYSKSYSRKEPGMTRKSQREFERNCVAMDQARFVDANEIMAYVSPFGSSDFLRAIKQSSPYALARYLRNRTRLRRLSKVALAGTKVPLESRDWYCGTSSRLGIMRHKSPVYKGDILFFQSGACYGSALALPGWWNSLFLGFEELCYGQFKGYVLGGPQADLLKHPEAAQIMTAVFNAD